MRLTSVIVIIVSPILSQAQDSKELITRYFNEVHAGNYPAIPLPVSLPENAKKTLSALAPYKKDTIAIVRVKAYAIIRYVGTKSRQSSMREQCVLELLQACRDKNSSNVGAALEYLKEFRKDDYTKAAKDTLSNLYKSKIAYVNKVITLAGYLQLTTLQPEFRTLADNTEANKRDRWAAQLALARMNDQQVIESLMMRIKKQGINDDVVYQLFPDLAYTHQRQAINYLVEILNSDAKDCSSADAEADVRIPCAYRVMEMLAPVIEDYPLKLSASGDVDTKDYTGALKIVRDWFKEHKDYKIVTDRY